MNKNKNAAVVFVEAIQIKDSSLARSLLLMYGETLLTRVIPLPLFTTRFQSALCFWPLLFSHLDPRFPRTDWICLLLPNTGIAERLPTSVKKFHPARICSDEDKIPKALLSIC